MAHRRSCLCASVAILLLISSVFRARAQITTPCTASVISSFTPCFNYLTGSSGTGSSPTEDCCNSLRSLMTDNVDCACLIITGNVPVSIPFINANLAISLPRVCKNSVPLQCKASGVPLPAPGPVLFGPTPAPAAPASRGHPAAPAPRGHPAAPAPAPDAHSPRASKAATAHQRWKALMSRRRRLLNFR
ncbi:non-specific lipid-transfer protein [Sesamum indicum]|uniref:Non-specific lipid-transfer protein n=1 Tax=Sesamum indicum TaxID=4182 RepID=A0A6I9TNG4_SESIN|nr:non-specific lipid-transfer protein [Sesamum indicum]